MTSSNGAHTQIQKPIEQQSHGKAMIWICTIWDTIIYTVFWIISVILQAPTEPVPIASRSAILITGASKGLGRHLAIRLASKGYTVFATVRQKQDAQSLLAEYSGIRSRIREDAMENWRTMKGKLRVVFGNATTIASTATGLLVPIIMDVASSDDRKAAYNTVKEYLDNHTIPLHLHAIVNNAAYTELMFVSAASDAYVDRMIDVNLKGPLGMYRAFLPLLTADKKGGRVINIGTPAAWMIGPMDFATGMYGIAKAGLRATTKWIDNEADTVNVRGILVEPGMMKTEGLAAHNTYEPLLSSNPNASISKDMPLHFLESLQEKSNHHAKAIPALGRTWAMPVSYVAAAVIHAIESPRPMTVYFPGLDVKIARFITLDLAFGDVVAGAVMKAIRRRRR